MGAAETAYSIPSLRALREAGFNCELYPEASKLKKQFDYANRKNIPVVIVAGESEIAEGAFTVKNMESGEQQVVSKEALAAHIATIL